MASPNEGMVTGQNDASGAAGESGPTHSARPEEAPTWAKLFSGMNALAWSAGIAVLVGFATCAGMARESGRSDALGLYSLSRPTIDQRDTFLGMITLLEAVLTAVGVS